MARRRRRARAIRIVVVAVLLATAAAAGWRWHEQRNGEPAAARGIVVRGTLTFAARPRDPQLGISADAALLFRDVQMLQWREHCVAAACTYDTAWSPEAVDSARFRQREGHVNPALPFASTRLDAQNLHLGPYAVDADVVAQLPAVAHAVQAADLPPNLAATFRIVDGVLVAGDPDHAGAIRISYRVVPGGTVQVTAVPRGNRLMLP